MADCYLRVNPACRHAARGQAMSRRAATVNGRTISLRKTWLGLRLMFTPRSTSGFAFKMTCLLNRIGPQSPNPSCLWQGNTVPRSDNLTSQRSQRRARNYRDGNKLSPHRFAHNWKLAHCCWMSLARCKGRTSLSDGASRSLSEAQTPIMEHRFAPTAVIPCTFLPSGKGRRAAVHE
jgi:hypothetical protein